MRASILSIVVLASAASVAGCDEGDDVGASSDPSPEPETVGVADDGSTIIFGGPRRSEGQAVSGSRSTDYDEEHLIREPNTPDPEEGEFTLEEAVVGLPIDGSLVVEIGTEMGTLLCDLYADRAPNTVANFVGLARGRRPWWDARAGEWRTEPYYQGLTFHRVIPDFLIQGGDYLGDGTGTVGYTIDDEPHDTLAHDRAGQLAMANHEGPDSAGAQFFITDGPAPQLDGQGYTIFGQCRPTHVVSQIARVPQDPGEGNRPLTPVHIQRLMVRRVEGGAEAAEPTRPQLPEGEPERPTGASPGPAELRGRLQKRREWERRASPMPEGRTGPPRPPLNPPE
ncbi:MAG TPA: peptidylprolyl isomerase [Sandaracinaceae bacterium LLY-WYZ-13_1]|nr:peptidylprolyl isomerase [Sandaracinaceae bacterium LLY-WYZ-13_1]